MTKYTHTGIVTRSDTKKTERIELRETKRCWVNGFHAWRKSSKSPRCRDLLYSGVMRYLTLDLSSIQLIDPKKQLLEDYNVAVRALNKAVRALDDYEAEHGK